MTRPDTFDKVFGASDCIADKETRQKYIDAAVKRRLPVVVKHKERKGKVAIVGSGPSVTEFVPFLKEWDGEIWGINRAFEWMRHRGVKPTGFIGIDPEWFLVECLPNIPQDVTYYIAAQVHPCVFDHLKERNVRLWYMADDQVKLPWGAYPIYGGSTAMSRAPNLAWALGWREVHIFGGDSSFTHKTHVHGDVNDGHTVIETEVDGAKFKTTRAMLSQAVEFVEQMPEWSRMEPPLSVSVYGDGLMPALLGQAMNSGGYERYIAEQAQMERKRA